MKIDHIGVPLDLGSERMGVDMAPNALRYQHFLRNLESIGLKMHDLGNINCPSPEEVAEGEAKAKYLVPIAAACKKLSLVVKNSIESGHKSLVVGGDHSIAIGSISGAANAIKRLGLIWIDAHGDMNTEETTPSGNIHGMPLAVVLGHGNKKLTQIAKKSPAVLHEDLIHIGAKDLDPGEVALIKKHNLTVFGVRDIVSEGLKPTLSAISALNARVDAIWVSLDLDAIDVAAAPGVGMPNRGGLTYREIQAIFEYIGLYCNVAGLDVVEYNPIHDIEHKTATLSTELAAKVFGKEYSWYTEYLREHKVK